MESPEVLAAAVSAVGAVLAAAIAAIAAALIGRRFAKGQELARQLELAAKDIAFLLAVEERHCELNKSDGHRSNRQLVRDFVRKHRELEWSGRFTPGRFRDRTRA